MTIDALPSPERLEKIRRRLDIVAGWPEDQRPQLAGEAFDLQAALDGATIAGGSVRVVAEQRDAWRALAKHLEDCRACAALTVAGSVGYCTEGEFLAAVAEPAGRT